MRFVLATLWDVHEVHAQALMTDFYTRLWKSVEGWEDPRSALRAAQQAAKERGVPFQDRGVDGDEAGGFGPAE